MRAAGPRRAGPGPQSGSHPDPRSPPPGALPGLCVLPCPEGSVARGLAGLCSRDCPGSGTARPAGLGGCLLEEGFGCVPLLRGCLGRAWGSLSHTPPGRTDTAKKVQGGWGGCKQPVPGHHRGGGGGGGDEGDPERRWRGCRDRTLPQRHCLLSRHPRSPLLRPGQRPCDPPSPGPAVGRRCPGSRPAPSGGGTAPRRQPWGRSAPWRRRVAAAVPGVRGGLAVTLRAAGAPPRVPPHGAPPSRPLPSPCSSVGQDHPHARQRQRGCAHRRAVKTGAGHV